jgi:hypothetical protein
MALFESAARDDAVGLVLRNALCRVEDGYESLLTRTSCAGAIFALKQMQWTDAHEIKGQVTISVEQMAKEAAQRRTRNITMEDPPALPSGVPPVVDGQIVGQAIQEQAQSATAKEGGQ